MPKSLQEYADWLAERDLIWPKPPPLESAKATAASKPLEGIRAVTWSLYGTLLRTSDGNLELRPEQKLRMQIALEKTIQEFNMWNSMYRKAGAPWEEMLHQYDDVLSQSRMTATKKRGDIPEVNLADIWHKLISRLQQKEYTYDASFYGDLDGLSEKVAYYFHSSLQGIEASPNALKIMKAIPRAGMTQGLITDAQPFTIIHLLRALSEQGRLPPLGELFDVNCLALSHQEKVRLPSPSLYECCLERMGKMGIEPNQILHVGCRLKDDLAVAKQLGMRTVLYAGDKLSLVASKEDVRNPELQPDRLITDLTQLWRVLGQG